MYIIYILVVRVRGSVNMKRRKFYKPTFRGSHNALKSKVLLILYEVHLTDPYGSSQWLTAKEIQQRTRCNYRSLLSRLPLFHEWKYVKIRKGQYGFIRYAIARAGRRYLEKYMRNGLMPVQRYLDEMKGAV